VRGYTPPPVIEEPEPDYNSMDYNRSVMYVQLCRQKKLKFYRDVKGHYHLGTPQEHDT